MIMSRHGDRAPIDIRCARFPGGGIVRVDSIRLASPEPGEIVVRVLRCALCGSDLRLWREGAPHIPGHEIVGVVDARGHPLAGQRVLVYIPVYCGACPYCRNGDTHLCEHLDGLIGWQRPGGYAEAVVVPERNVIPIPDDIPTDLAPLLLDTIGTPAHALRLARRVVGAGPAVVLGAGPLGLGTLLALRCFGYAPLYCAEPSPYRAAAAKEVGAKLLEGESAGRRFPIVIEASGNLAARSQGLHMTAPGGVLVLLGETSTPWTIHPMPELRRKDFFVLRSFYFPLREINDNINLLRRGRSDYARLVDSKAPLENLGTLFERFAAGELLKPELTFE